MALKRSMRKLRRTRAGSQFGSVTARKLTVATARCHRFLHHGPRSGRGR
jgi:hypothetical protein